MIETITLTGGLPRDAELRFSPSGNAVANFTLASSDNKYNEQANQWEKSRALYLDVTIWDETQSERRPNAVKWAHLAADLAKGDQVAVVGKLHTRQWEDRDGTKRSRTEFLASKFYVMPDTNAGGSQPQQGAQAAQWGNQGGFSAAQNNVNSVMGDDEPPF